MTLTLEDKDQWNRLGWETSFSAIAPDEYLPKWWVMDAECETVCICESEEAARVIVKALDEYGHAVWRIEDSRL